MFKLLKLENLNYRVYKQVAGVDTEVSEDQLSDVMQALGVSDSELKAALDDMYRNDHNCADFGLSVSEPGTWGFIFSDNRVVKSRTTTEVVFAKQDTGSA